MFVQVKLDLKNKIIYPVSELVSNRVFQVSNTILLTVLVNYIFFRSLCIDIV